MTSMERVVACLQGKEADRVPATPLICGASRRVYGITYGEWSQDYELAAKSWIQAQEMFGFDCFVTLVDLSVECADFGQEVVFPVEDTAHPNYDKPVIVTPDDYLTKVERIDPTKTPRMSGFIKMHEILQNEKGAEVPVVAFVFGPLGILSMMRGAERMFLDCMKHPEAVIKAQEVITEVLVDYIKALAKTGVPAIMLDTLYASGTIMKKSLWQKIEAPFAKRLADTIRECGCMVMVHNCGQNIYFDAQIEAMEPVLISCAYTPDDCATWTETKEKWGDKTTICGYMEPARYCFLGTPDMVKEECKKEIEELKAGGKFILSPGCEFPPNASFLNAQAIMEAAEIYGKY